MTACVTNSSTHDEKTKRSHYLGIVDKTMGLSESIKLSMAPELKRQYGWSGSDVYQALALSKMAHLKSQKNLVWMQKTCTGEPLDPRWTKDFIDSFSKGELVEHGDAIFSYIQGLSVLRKIDCLTPAKGRFVIDSEHMKRTLKRFVDSVNSSVSVIRENLSEGDRELFDVYLATLNSSYSDLLEQDFLDQVALDNFPLSLMSMKDLDAKYQTFFKESPYFEKSFSTKSLDYPIIKE